MLQKSTKFKEIPIKALREFFELIFNEFDFEKKKKIDETTKYSKDNSCFSNEKTKIFVKEEDNNLKNTAISEENVPKNEEDKFSKKKNSKLPPIGSSKLPPLQTQQESPIISTSKPDVIKKKILNNYGKFEIIEEERVGESVESYNDYLIKIKHKNEESFSVVIIFLYYYF